MIQECLTKGCDYEIGGVLIEDTVRNAKTLTLNVIHLGSLVAMEELQLIKVIAYTKYTKYNVDLSEPVRLKGNGQKTINLDAG